jgi:flagellar biosynthetic protein FlhB
VAEDEESRTEEATPQRRSKAHEEGQFAKVADAGGIAALAGVFMLILFFGASAFEQLRLFAATCFRDTYALARGDGAQIVLRSTALLGLLCLPVMLVGLFTSAAAGIAQSGFDLNFGRLELKFERLNFFANIKNVLNPFARLPEIGTQLARVVVIAWLTWGVARDAYPRMVRAARTSLDNVTEELIDAITRIATRAVLAFVVLVVADYYISKFRVDKALRMTKQEVKDENKQNEGDPRVKGQIKQRGRERIRKAIGTMVKTADVIVTNPTHIAIAIRYRPQDGIPIVVAKGYDEIAMHIRKIAREQGIPILENKPLARGLAAKVKVGKPITQEFFSPVAEVLAYVYRLKGRMGGASRSARGGASAR